MYPNYSGKCQKTSQRGKCGNRGKRVSKFNNSLKKIVPKDKLLNNSRITKLTPRNLDSNS